MEDQELPPSSQSDRRPHSPADLLDAVQARRFVIQDFRPMAESLDWELGQLSWDQRGGQSFATHEVPITINNDGLLSEKAAAVLFASLQETDAGGEDESRISVMELGVGLGLYARYFLDAFRRLCRQHDKTFYNRIHYIATDRSQRMLEDIRQREIFSGHEGHYELRTLDATRLEEDPATGLRAVFLNYVLDALPATLLEVNEVRASQLYLRVCLARSANPKAYSSLDPSEIGERASSPDAGVRSSLVDLYHLFSIDGEFRPVAAGAVPYLEFAIEFARRWQPPLRHILLNHAAIAGLEQLLQRLEPNGFILMNDYGLARPEEASENLQYQHLGAATAISVNFPLLGAYFGESGRYVWTAPVEDYTRLFSRMVSPSRNEQAIATFQRVFHREAFQVFNEPIEAARAHAQGGRNEAALAAYREALAMQPLNWAVISEVSRFLSLAIRDHKACLQLVQAGLSRNPISSSLLNTLGDTLVMLGRYEEAWPVFQRALQINPNDAGAMYSLAFILIHRNDLHGALRMIAEGLVHDDAGEYRERLLERQAEILNRQTQMRQQKAQFLANRFSGVRHRRSPAAEGAGS